MDFLNKRENVKGACTQKETLCIGDSFIGIFNLFRDTAHIDIVKVKGGTAKGLHKAGGSARSSLESRLEKNHYNCAIFNFGQVDIHLSFYYDLLIKKQVDDNEYYDSLAHNYVEFIAGLKNIDNKYVMAVYPSPQKDPEKIVSLNLIYGF